MDLPVGNATARRWYKSQWAWSAVTIVAVIALKTLFELTPWGQYLEDRAYELLLAGFVGHGTKTRPDVLIIDIWTIKAARWERDGRSGEATPRPTIQDLIEVLSEPAMHAKAIGVDVDFSPENGKLNHPDDLIFFDWCLARAKETRVPIVLGVKRAALSADEWLADDRYQRLAGFIGVRKSAHWREHWPDRAIYWIWAGNGNPLRSMSAALAGVPLGQLMNERKRWATEASSIIDFAPLQRIQDDNVVHLDFASPLRRIQNGDIGNSEIRVDKDSFRAQIKDRVENRIVLIGDATKEACDPAHDRDCFHVTGVPKPVRGVFLHACAAMTIIAAKPINQLTLLGRLVIDSILAGLVIFAVKVSIWLRSCFSLPVGRFEDLWKDFIFTVLMIVIVIIAAVGWISYTRLLWTDFIIVCIVLFFQLIIDATIQIYRARKSGAETG
jgi:CHASE2 domain-containing sensor protein